MSESAQIAPRRPDIVAPPRDPLTGALIDSRQRWRDFVTLAADVAFETDALGRFVFVDPESGLGWPSTVLIGQPAELLLADTSGVTGFNPFRPTAPIRRRRAWLKCPNGGVRCMAFSVAPLLDPNGGIIGARGIGLDVTELDSQEAQVAAALRRGEVMDHILRSMREEVMAPRMMEAALASLGSALGAEGAAVVEALGIGQGPTLLYHSGMGAEAVLPTAVALLDRDAPSSVEATCTNGRPVLLCACKTRFGERMGLTIWRQPDGRPWNAEEQMLADSASTIIRVILEHDVIQREMGRQARTDPLTGLLNRRAFLEELERNIERLERESLPGTLMFIDLDHFKLLNDQLGHEAGDEALRLTAALLRKTVRPTDLVARFGGDEFAVWLNGADHLTAAERAESLRVEGPRALRHLTEGKAPDVTMSIGIATRRSGAGAETDELLRRADLAMYDVKRTGRAHWRVAHETPG
jgi:diguanylate cyclase (GGDEF)-like protein